jgi:hypothetical protein
MAHARRVPRCPRTTVNSQRSPSAATCEPEAGTRFEPASTAREPAVVVGLDVVPSRPRSQHRVGTNLCTILLRTGCKSQSKGKLVRPRIDAGVRPVPATPGAVTAAHISCRYQAGNWPEPGQTTGGSRCTGDSQQRITNIQTTCRHRVRHPGQTPLPARLTSSGCAS